MQAWGLIVLLISKAAGHLNVDDMEEDKAAGVLHRYVSDVQIAPFASKHRFRQFLNINLLILLTASEPWQRLQR